MEQNENWLNFDPTKRLTHRGSKHGIDSVPDRFWDVATESIRSWIDKTIPPVFRSCVQWKIKKFDHGCALGWVAQYLPPEGTSI